MLIFIEDQIIATSTQLLHEQCIRTVCRDGPEAPPDIVNGVTSVLLQVYALKRDILVEPPRIEVNFDNSLTNWNHF